LSPQGYWALKVASLLVFCFISLAISMPDGVPNHSKTRQIRADKSARE
jgi:hypothetical protein